MQAPAVPPPAHARPARADLIHPLPPAPYAARFSPQAGEAAKVSPLLRAALNQLVPLRFWALWATDFAAYLARWAGSVPACLSWVRRARALRRKARRLCDFPTPRARRRCLTLWLHLCKRGGRQGAPPAGPAPEAGVDPAAAAAHRFVAEQNASAGCLPCIQLLSGEGGRPAVARPLCAAQRSPLSMAQACTLLRA